MRLRLRRSVLDCFSFTYLLTINSLDHRRNLLRVPSANYDKQHYWVERENAGNNSIGEFIHQNFRSVTKGLITWRISARAEISARLGELIFCCDYITNFSPGWNISLGAKYEIVCEKSPENQNGAENTNRENRRIASLLVWPFVGAQFLTFGIVTPYNDDGTETKPVS